MILHFIFVVKEEDHERRKPEFDYIQQMSQVFKVWITEKFGKESFDILISHEVIEHIRDWKKSVAEMKTVLKPNNGDCCVYCSYGTVTCPSIQESKSSGNTNCC